ncbi:MAG: hypothetical protein ACJAR2_001793 [Ilumatobacter sp.]|jgi:hypothetical protein
MATNLDFSIGVGVAEIKPTQRWIIALVCDGPRRRVLRTATWVASE